MACNTCKKKNLVTQNEVLTTNKSLGKKIRDGFFNFLLFLVLTAIVVPLIIPVSVVALFNLIMLEKTINIYPMMLYIGQRFVKKYGEEEEEEDEEDDDDYDNLDEEEYELENPNDVFVLKK